MFKKELLILRKTLTELLDKGFIRASSSSAGAPVLFVKKPGGGVRFCVDYRALNAITRNDRYPLPLVKETLRNISRAKWYTKVDVRSAFYKLRIKEGDEWKTAFRTRFGLFEWLVTPFGLTGAPATFQRYINTTLKDFLDDFCSAYIDDVLIYSSGSRKDHERKVKLVLSRLRDAGLSLDINKCEFAVTETKYLGFIVEAGKGIRMDPDKVLAIRDWEAPKTTKGVRSFLGFTNFYREFLSDYAEKTAPLTQLTRKGTPFQWESAQEAAFEELKKAVISQPILAYWDPSRTTVVEADCSGYSLGGCLLQEDEQGLLRPVAYHSRKLTPAESNYDIHDKELLAIMSCLRAWDAELRGVESPFTVLSDHKNLRYFMTTKRLTERQVRWAQELAKYSFSLTFREGRLSGRPDALSRREQDLPKGVDDPRLAGRDLQLLQDKWLPDKLRVSSFRAAEVVIRKMTAWGQEVPEGKEIFQNEDLQEAWDTALARDESYSRAIQAVREGDRQFPPELKLKVSIAECTIDDRGLLKFRDRLWIPAWEPLTTALIQNTHDSYLAGHPGRDTTQALLARGYFWPGIARTVRRFCRNCDVCGHKTVWRERRKGLLKPLPIPDRFHSELSIDFMTDLPAASEQAPSFLMVIKDRLSKQVTLEAMLTMDAEACAERFVQCHWRFHSFPTAITSDRGSNWTGRF
jgi:hypothetical protein